MGGVHLRYLAASGPARRHLLLHGILRPGRAARAVFRQAHRAANAGTQGGAHRSRRAAVPVAAVLSWKTVVSGAIGVCLSCDRCDRTYADFARPACNRSSYAGLPERFFARINPVPVAAAASAAIQSCAERGVGSRHRRTSTPRRWRACFPEMSCRRDCSRSPWPMRAINSAISCRSSATAARILLGEAQDRGGSAPRHSIEGLGPNPLFARRRRPRRARPGTARISRQRGHACARHSDDARARRGRHRRAGVSRRSVAGGDIDASGGELRARRHVSIFRRARRRGCRSTARRLCDRAPLPGGESRRSSRIWRCCEPSPMPKRRSSPAGCTWASFMAS